jgi:hypothetical protein
LGLLKEYGSFLNIQWIWTIYIILIHSIPSVVTSLFLSDCWFYDLKDQQLLSKRGRIVIIILITLLTLLFTVNIVNNTDALYKNFNYPYIHNFISILLMILLLWVGKKINRNLIKRVNFRRSKLTLIGFDYMFILVVGTFFFANFHVLISIIFT